MWKPCLSLAVAVLAAPTGAQDDPDAALSVTELVTVLEGLETKSPYPQRSWRADDPWHVFKDLSLEFVQLSDRDGNSVPGLKYDYSRMFGEIERDGTDWSSYLRLTSAGTIAFDGDVRPRDFLESELTWRVSFDRGGITSPSDSARISGLRDAFRKHADEDADADERAAAEMEAMSYIERKAGESEAAFDTRKQALSNELASSRMQAVLAAAAVESEAELQRNDEYLMLSSEAVMEDQWHFDLGLDLGLENDQDFSQRQYTFGLASSLEFKAWEEQSWLPYANVVDYPAAFLRMLTGYDEGFEPGGHLFPILSFDVAQVAVDRNRARAGAGDDDDFLRAHFEASYRAPVGEIGEDLYYLDAGYHHYADLDPSGAIEAAGLDDYDYFKVELSTAEGVFASVDVGQLPFEARDTTVVSLGYRFAGRPSSRR